MTTIRFDALNLMAQRNCPLLTALEYCIEALEKSPPNPDVDLALRCARAAARIERAFQARHRRAA